MGVVIKRCRFPHIAYPYSTCIRFFLPKHPYFFVRFFSFLFMLFLCNIANIAQRTFEIIQKSRSREHDDIILSTSSSTTSPVTSKCEALSDVSFTEVASSVQ